MIPALARKTDADLLRRVRLHFRAFPHGVDEKYLTLDLQGGARDAYRSRRGLGAGQGATGDARRRRVGYGRGSDFGVGWKITTKNLTRF